MGGRLNALVSTLLPKDYGVRLFFLRFVVTMVKNCFLSIPYNVCSVDQSGYQSYKGDLQIGFRAFSVLT
jgi:hypothetical protein